jgi:hypothetical protein
MEMAIGKSINLIKLSSLTNNSMLKIKDIYIKIAI